MVKFNRDLGDYNSSKNHVIEVVSSNYHCNLFSNDNLRNTTILIGD